jgi:hypothetical protein
VQLFLYIVCARYLLDTSSERSSSASVAVPHPRVQALQANKMAGVIENYSKFEVLAVDRSLQVEGMSQSEIHRRSVTVYGENAFS